MPDTLTEAERAAIEAALAAGRVTRVPTGAMATAAEYRWQDGKGLVATDPEVARQAYARWHGRKREPAVQRRREHVAALRRGGMTGPQIAARLQVPTSTIYADLVALDRAGVALVAAPPPEAEGEAAMRRRPVSPRVAARRAQIPGLMAEGLTRAEAVARLGCTINMLGRDLQDMGLIWAGRRLETPPEVVAERRARLVDLLRAGHRRKAAARILGVPETTIRNDMTKLGGSVAAILKGASDGC